MEEKTIKLAAQIFAGDVNIGPEKAFKRAHQFFEAVERLQHTNAKKRALSDGTHVPIEECPGAAELISAVAAARIRARESNLSYAAIDKAACAEYNEWWESLDC